MTKIYESVYKELYMNARDFKRFKIDLKKKNLSIENKNFLKEGKVCEIGNLIRSDDLMMIGINDCFENPWGEVLPKLYDLYKHSYISNKKYQKKSLFRAINKSDLSDYDVVHGIDRNYAVALLEGYILLASLNGVLLWQDEAMWFWQGEDKDFVVKRDWLSKPIIKIK